MAFQLSFYTVICTVALALSFAWQQIRSYARLRHVPGSSRYAASGLSLALDAWQARYIHAIRDLHTQYGPVVRVGPNQVSFNSLSALRTIYGAGSSFEKTSFYRMFDVYGTPNLFTFQSGIDHRNRKKLVSHIYSNQRLLEDRCSAMVKQKVQGFLDMLRREPDLTSDVFTSLHYFSFDAITEFVYGPKHGGTSSLAGNKVDRRLIDDILDPKRRRLAWFAIHFPTYTKWVTTRTGITETLVNLCGLLPMKKPFTYSGIRRHSLEAFYRFKSAVENGEQVADDSTVIGRLFQVREKQSLSDMDIASECADHILAGIDTTADSLMFVIWALSLPQHEQFQSQLRQELETIEFDDAGWPDAKVLNRLPWLNAVLKESLRLYAPLPAFEPRSAQTDIVIDGTAIPAGTIVGMSPYCMHRNASVFPSPFKFDPERWLTEDSQLLPESADPNRWFWAFSSGARMCIGIHLAYAEMLMLIAVVYRRYHTLARHPDTTPGITSRFEIFYDETMPKMQEHECWIDFQEIAKKI